ncbi:Mbov_0838 family PARCEL repeat surface lipoprotein [Mycoplasmopsis bovis]|uniref:Mbov_0838 family PARCEL repeat surface lipoprotein n=2 Tax=Mycoplasmopsis bovis TaxID=28903 RepID=UPI00125DDFC5|nr:BspA family leucine-rich repeat surface protein [Mycoplasmopsis bovis]
MKKKIKKLNIFSSLSFLPLMPLVAASCKKNGNDEKIQIINNESNPQTSKQMTPPPNSHGNQSKDDSSNVDKTTDAKNNSEKSEPIVTPKDQSDESRSEAGKNDNVNTIPMNNDEEEKKLKEKQEQDSVLQKVLDTWNKDFKDDIWEKWSYKDIFEKLKSKIPNNNLKLVSDQNTRPTPGSENPPFVIKLNDSSNKQVLPFGMVWPISSKTEYSGNEAITIGYDNEGKIEKFRSSTNKVPEHLPKFISSLSEAFENSTQKTIENLDKWDTSNINNFEGVFKDASNFNHDISGWNTDSAETMQEMFTGATHFNQNISNWNTSNVTDMTSMFWGATNFNQDLNSWNVEKVTSMQNMFSETKKFNSDLDKWQPKSIKSVFGMFANSMFNKSLKSWESHLPNKILNAQDFNRNAILNEDNLPVQITKSIKHFEDLKKAGNNQK